MKKVRLDLSGEPGRNTRTVNTFVDAVIQAVEGETKMSNAKHTPEPWVYDTHRGGDTTACRVRHAGLEVATVYGETPEESEANARLISAAPDMYKALKDALSTVEVIMENSTYDADAVAKSEFVKATLDMVKTAISKAEGG